MKKLKNCFLSVIAVSSLSMIFVSCANNDSSTIDNNSQPVSNESISSDNSTSSISTPAPFKFNTAYLDSVKNDALGKDLYLKINNVKIPTVDQIFTGGLYFKVVNEHIFGGLKVTATDKYMQLDNSIVAKINNGIVYANANLYSYNHSIVTIDGIDYNEYTYAPENSNYYMLVDDLLGSLNLDLTEADLVTYYNDAIDQLTNYSISEDVLDYINYEEIANDIVMTLDYEAIDAKITEYYNYYDTYTFSEAVNAILGDGSFDKLKTTIPVITSQNVRSLLAMLKLNGFDYEEYLDKFKSICDEVDNEQLTAIYEAINTKLHDKEFLNSIVGDIIIEYLHLVDDDGNPISVDDLNDKIIAYLDDNKDVVVKTLIDNITNSTTVSDTVKKVFDIYKDVMEEVKTSTINVIGDKDGHFKSATVAYTSDDLTIDGNIVCEIPEELTVNKLDFNPTSADGYKAVLASFFDDSFEDIIENSKVIGHQRKRTYYDNDYDDPTIVIYTEIEEKYYYSDSYNYEEDENNIYFMPAFKHEKVTTTTNYIFEDETTAKAALESKNLTAGVADEATVETKINSLANYGDYVQYNKTTKEYTSIEDIPEEELTFDHQVNPVGCPGDDNFVPGVKYYKDSKGNIVEHKFYLEVIE